MLRFLPIIMTISALVLVSPGIAPQGFAWVGAAHAQDDDDDDAPRQRRIRGNDDDDDDGPRRRAPARAAAPLPQRAPNEILVRGLSDEELSGLEGRGFSVLQRRDLTGGLSLTRLRKPQSLSMADARREVRQLQSPQGADFNHYYRVEQAEDCQGVDCLAREMIEWPVTEGCGNLPLIGMVDTGLNADHAALSDADIRLHRVQSESPVSDLLHGTAVASLLVGDSASRSPGLVPQAGLVAVDAFYKDRKDQRADAFALIEALDYLAGQDVRVINLSLAGPPNRALEREIRRLDDAGIVVVAAAGNNGPAAKPAYPAAYDQVIAVTAVDRRGQVYRRANRGAHIDIAAPGVDVWTAASVSGARTKTGTSYAAPFVTAAVAMMLQRQPELTPAEVRDRVVADARDLGDAGRDHVFGQGLLTPPQDCRVAPTPSADGVTRPN